MPATIPNLWPQNVLNVEALAPIVILRAQAPLLAQMTKGLLEAEIITESNGKGDIRHSFDVIAPGLNNYRHRLFVCQHKADMVYPVIFDSVGYSFLDGSPLAYSEREFESKLSEVLKSNSVIAVLYSLIARSNEARPPTPIEDDTEESE